jgi:hypothetical protein
MPVALHQKPAGHGSHVEASVAARRVEKVVTGHALNTPSPQK